MNSCSSFPTRWGRIGRCWSCAPPSEAKADAYPNLTVKKIPRQVLSRCEWGHDDYSLQVENLPKEPPKPGQQSLFDGGEP
jgi:hypothetical protein